MYSNISVTRYVILNDARALDFQELGKLFLIIYSVTIAMGSGIEKYDWINSEKCGEIVSCVTKLMQRTDTFLEYERKMILCKKIKMRTNYMEWIIMKILIV